MMNIMRFLDLHGREPGLVLARPVADEELARQRDGHLVGHLARLVQVLELDADAGRPIEPEHALRVFLVDHGQRRVVLVVARIEGADHGELLEPRHHARRRHLAARRHQRDLVARLDEQRTRQFAAEHDAELARHQLVERALLRRGGNVGHLGFELGHDAAHQRALHVLAARNERLRGNEGRGADHLGVLPRGRGDGFDVGQGLAVARKDFDVRHHAEHAVAHLFLEAVHHADSTMISAATPNAMPSIDTPEMKEMKPLRRVARPARV
jgi:hypothetical protein